MGRFWSPVLVIAVATVLATLGAAARDSGPEIPHSTQQRIASLIVRARDSEGDPVAYVVRPSSEDPEVATFYRECRGDVGDFESCDQENGEPTWEQVITDDWVICRNRGATFAWSATWQTEPLAEDTAWVQWRILTRTTVAETCSAPEEVPHLLRRDDGYNHLGQAESCRCDDEGRRPCKFFAESLRFEGAAGNTTTKWLEFDVSCPAESPTAVASPTSTTTPTSTASPSAAPSASSTNTASPVPRTPTQFPVYLPRCTRL